MFGSKTKKPIAQDAVSEITSFLIGKLADPDKDAFRARQAQALSFQNEDEATHALFNLYYLLEQKILADQPQRYPTPGALRKEIGKRFHLDRFVRAPFSLLFFPREVQIFYLLAQLIGRFGERLRWDAAKLAALIREVAAGTFLDLVKIEGGKLAFADSEARFLAGRYAEPIRELEQQFGRVIRRLYHEVRLSEGGERVRASVEEMFHAVKRDWGHLDVLQNFLAVMPEGVLSEIRYEFLPKRELEEELHDKMRELEAVNIRLHEEARKLKETVENLENAKIQMQKMQEAQGEFIRVVSHQFRTPLSVIRWQSEVASDFLSAKKPEGAPELQEDLDAIHAKSVFLVGVLNNVFDLLAIESNAFHLNKKPTPIWELLEESRKEFAREAERLGVGLIFEKAALPTEECLIDPEKIRKTIAILLDNAIRYTPKGGTVTIGLEKMGEGEKGLFRVFVRDTGIGLRPEEREKIFTKFYRSHEAQRQAPDGAGIGLAIAKHIVEAHGGKIWVESEGTGKGSTFHFTLPKA